MPVGAPTSDGMIGNGDAAGVRGLHRQLLRAPAGETSHRLADDLE